MTLDADFVNGYPALAYSVAGDTEDTAAALAAYRVLYGEPPIRTRVRRLELARLLRATPTAQVVYLASLEGR